jgi:hypothetical protein
MVSFLPSPDNSNRDRSEYSFKRSNNEQRRGHIRIAID